MYLLEDLSVDDALIMARHLYLKTEDIDKVLFIQEALEYLFASEIYLKMDIPIKYSAYTLIGHALNASYAIANDPGMHAHPDDIKIAQQFDKCAKTIANFFSKHIHHLS